MPPPSPLPRHLLSSDHYLPTLNPSQLLPYSTRVQYSWQHRCLSTWVIDLMLPLLILSYLSRSLSDRWGTTVDFTTSFLHSSQLSAFRSMIFHSRPVHSLMLSSHHFLCLPLHLCPLTVPCRMVLASPDNHVTCPYHFILHKCLYETQWLHYIYLMLLMWFILCWSLRHSVTFHRG